MSYLQAHPAQPTNFGLFQFLEKNTGLDLIFAINSMDLADWIFTCLL
jgi:hypothetical protein